MAREKAVLEGRWRMGTSDYPPAVHAHTIPMMKPDVLRCIVRINGKEALGASRRRTSDRASKTTVFSKRILAEQMADSTQRGIWNGFGMDVAPFSSQH